jgi:serine/threonine protein kinase
MADLPLACPECGAHYPYSFAHCPKDGSKLGARDALAGQELGGRYRVLSRIGVGAMGSVYAANDLRLERRVAIKLLSSDVRAGDTSLERFRQEVKTLSLLRHENIVEVLDFQHERGRHYFVMEFLRGEDLESLLARGGRLEVERTARIVEQCTRALGAAHKQGVVHRDLKPANIFLSETESRQSFVKVLDFGVAKMLNSGEDPWMRLTGLGETWGTPCYMAPEQAEGLESDGRADIYSLGIMIYEMLCGKVPFDGSSPLLILQQQVESPPPPFSERVPGLELPAAVEALVRKALAKRPEDRFETMSALNLAFREALRSARVERLHAAFHAYNVPEPTAEAQRQLAELDPEGLLALESLRRVLAREHARVLDELERERAEERLELTELRRQRDSRR